MAAAAEAEGRKNKKLFLPSGIIIISSQPVQCSSCCCRKLPGREKRKWGEAGRERGERARGGEES